MLNFAHGILLGIISSVYKHAHAWLKIFTLYMYRVSTTTTWSTVVNIKENNENNKNNTFVKKQFKLSHFTGMDMTSQHILCYTELKCLGCTKVTGKYASE